MFERLLHASALLIGLIIVDGFTQAARAQGFLDRLRGEPQTFDECLLKNMRGVTSDEAARAITFACRNRHPTNAPARPAIVEVTHLARELNGELIQNPHTSWEANFYHNTPNLFIVEVSFRWGVPGNTTELRCTSYDTLGVEHGRSGRFNCGHVLQQYRQGTWQGTLRAFGYRR
jgi:hypothetical protein